jgi:hypothetical protein
VKFPVGRSEADFTGAVQIVLNQKPETRNQKQRNRNSV